MVVVMVAPAASYAKNKSGEVHQARRRSSSSSVWGGSESQYSRRRRRSWILGLDPNLGLGFSYASWEPEILKNTFDTLI